MEKDWGNPHQHDFEILGCKDTCNLRPSIRLLSEMVIIIFRTHWLHAGFSVKSWPVLFM